MNAIKISLAVALAASTLAMTPSFAVAADAAAPREITVRYDELNMSSASGASVLYARLRSASRSVCDVMDGRELRQHAAYNACYQQALSNAVAKVNRTSVTALHERTIKGAKAS
jgi:UrcA family protein